MACSDSGGSKTFLCLCLGLFVAASSFCHCTTLTRLKALDKLKENSTLSRSQAKVSGLRHGRLLIGQNSLKDAKLKETKVMASLLAVDTDYQADMGWLEPKQPEGQGEGFSRLRPDGAAVEERLLKMEPKVECTSDSMKLQVQDAPYTPGSLFFVDRGSRLSPLPLSKLPPNCGYTVRSTRTDLVLVAPYDGCFVSLEEDSYVLPLRWWGVPVRMSCPLMRQSSPNPPMVTCHTVGMVVKTEWTVSVAKIKVNLNGSWEPLMKASPRCGFSVVVHPEGVVISVHYSPCLEKKDGMYTLELLGDGKTKISCPSLSAAQSESTESSATGPKLQTERPSKELHPTAPLHSSGSTYAPTQSPWFTVPQVPGFPQYPEVPNQGPEVINQPQLPSYPFYHYFYPDAKPTPSVQPLSSPVTKKNGQQSQTVFSSNPSVAPEGHVPLPLVPVPFYRWPAQPEKVPEKEPSVQPPATQINNGEAEIPFYNYPYYVNPLKPVNPPVHRPEVKPVPTTSPPVIQTGEEGQRQQPYYLLPFFHPPPKLETSPQPPVTKPPSKLDEHALPNPFKPLPGPPQKPVGPPANQPEGQEYIPFNPFRFYPTPPQPPASKYPLEALHPETPENTVPPKPPLSQEPQGQLYHPFYQYPLYPPFLPQGPYQTQMPPSQETPSPAPNSQVQQPVSLLQPDASKPKVPEYVSPSKPAAESKEPSQPEAPQGQVHYYTYPQPTTVQRPPQPEIPWGQMHQLVYPYHIYPQPEPENQPSEGSVYKPPYPQSAMIPSAGTNSATTRTEKPVPSEQPPNVRPPHDQVYPFNLHYPQEPQHPQAITLPPVASTQQPQHVTITQPSNAGVLPQGPKPGSPHMPSLYCPQVCPSGFSNCCPQIAFHQHLHHIVPAEPGSKTTSPVYPALPFLPSVVYSGLGPGIASLPPEPTEATTQAFSSSTSAPTSLQTFPPGHVKQPHLLPPDGHHGVLTSIPRKPTNPEQSNYPYFVPNSNLMNQPYRPKNERLSQSQSAAYYNVPSKPQTLSNNPVNPVGWYYIQPPEQQMSQLSPAVMNNLQGPDHMSYIRHYQQAYMANQQNEPTAKKMQPSNKKSTESEGQTHPDRFLVPYDMLQDAQASTYNSSQPQQFVSSSKKSTKHEQTAHPYSEPKSYVLLQHAPPGRDKGFNESPLPFRDLVHDINFLTQNLARHRSSEPQHLQTLQSHHPKRLEKMSSSLPGNVNDMPKPGVKSESFPLFVSALDHPHFVPLPQHPSFSVTHLKPEFPHSLKNMWKPLTPQGSNQRIPASVPGNGFQQLSSSADHQANGMNHPMQREGGNREH